MVKRNSNSTTKAFLAGAVRCDNAVAMSQPLRQVGTVLSQRFAHHNFLRLVPLLIACLTQQFTILADENAKIANIPDAIGLDINSEGILARGEVRDTSVELTQGTIGGLKQILTKPDIGLVSTRDFSLEDRFAARTFAYAPWVAAKRLINESAKQNRTRKIDDDIVDQNLESLLKLAAQSADFETAIETIDRLIERKWTARARELLYTIEPSLLRKDDSPKSEQAAQLWMRLLYCSYLDEGLSRFGIESEIIKSVYGDTAFAPKFTTKASAGTISKVVDRWRLDLEQRKKAREEQTTKQIPLNAYSKKIFEYQFDDQRYAPPKNAFPGFPPAPYIVEAKGNKGEAIFARRSNQLFSWCQGESHWWPDDKQVEQLNLNSNWNGPDLNLSDEASLGGFAAYDDTVFALVDSRERSSAASDVLRDALLVGLKLPQTNQAIDNTPMTARRSLAEALTAQSKDKATFKGTPLIVGQQLFVMVSDDSRSRVYRIACFELPLLKLSWISSTLGIEGNSASGVSNACLLYREGRLFVANGRGSVVALQSSDGKTLFQVNYSTRTDSPYDAAVLPRIRTSLVSAGDAIICCASDADTIFAIDFCDGHVHWAVDPEQAARAPQIVGIVGDDLICMGDRIAWLDVNTGLPRRVVELARNAIPIGDQIQLLGESAIWSNGTTIFRYSLRKNDQTLPYLKVKVEDLEQWPYLSRERLAFCISNKYLSIVAPSDWVVFEAK